MDKETMKENENDKAGINEVENDESQNEENNSEIGLIVGVNEKISFGKAMFLGLQHVLSMDLFVMPFVLAGILQMNVAQTALFISATFFAAGIATLIQTGWGMKLPVMQGPSYVPIGAMAAIGNGLGLGYMFGSLLPGAAIIALLGYPFKLFSKIIRKLIPALVAGTVIIVVGISLMVIALNNIFSASGDIGQNVLVSAITVAILIVFIMLGVRLKGAGRYIRVTSVVLAIIGGTFVASLFGQVDLSPVGKAAWFSLPNLFPFGVPKFDLSAILTMLFIYFIVLLDTTGTWFTISVITGEKLTEQRLNGAAAGEGLGCFLGTLFGGPPVVGYSSNAGVMSITGVASRWAIMGGGVILIVLGMIPKLMSIIACVPGTVINGVFVIVAVLVTINGIRVIRPYELDERNMFVIGIPIFFALASALLPTNVYNTLPSLLNYMMSSGTAVGGLAAVILNLIIPESKNTKAINNV
jgi:NCS2 family nucleobase:cation symporter-2